MSLGLLNWLWGESDTPIPPPVDESWVNNLVISVEEHNKPDAYIYPSDPEYEASHVMALPLSYEGVEPLFEDYYTGSFSGRNRESFGPLNWLRYGSGMPALIGWLDFFGCDQDGWAYQEEEIEKVAQVYPQVLTQPVLSLTGPLTYAPHSEYPDSFDHFAVGAWAEAVMGLPPLTNSFAHLKDNDFYANTLFGKYFYPFEVEGRWICIDENINKAVVNSLSERFPVWMEKFKVEMVRICKKSLEEEKP